MSELFHIDSKGQLQPGDDELLLRLRAAEGTYWLAPTAPDLFVGLRSPPTGLRTESERAILAGDLSGISLPDIIIFLAQGRITGMLRVITPSGQCALLFKSGEVRSAATDSAGASLDEIAIGLGYVNRERLREVLPVAPSDGRIGRAMVDAGLLMPDDLLRCMNHQATEVMAAMVNARSGSFVVCQQEVPNRAPLNLNAQGLLMDAIRRIDELSEAERSLPPLTTRLSQGAPLPTEESAGAAAVLFSYCAVERTVEEVLRFSGINELEAARALKDLLKGGHLLAEVEISAEEVGAGTVTLTLKSPEETVAVFEEVFKELFGEALRNGLEKELYAAAHHALTSQLARSPILAGFSFGADGALPLGILLSNARGSTSDEMDASRKLHASLSELMFFLLYETSERLDDETDQALLARIKKILDRLESPK